MKNSIYIFVLALALLTSCAKQKKIEVSPIPNDRTEWTVVLSSPVLPVHQEVESYFLSAQVLEIFKEEKLASTVNLPANALKIANKLPGETYSAACYTANFICWPLQERVGEWNQTFDPKQFVYIIDYYRSNPLNDVIAFWFVDDHTIRCKKLDLFVKRQVAVDLPRFTKPVKWQWYFEGDKDAHASLAKGKHVESTEHLRYASAVTTSCGGGRFTLPKSRTTIIADGKLVYAE